MVKEKKELAVVTTPDTLDKLAILDRITEKLYKSGMFPHLKTGAQAFAVAEYGVELGFTPMVSMQHIAIVKGKLCIEAKLLVDKFTNAGGKIKKIKSTKEECALEVEYKRNKTSVAFDKATAQRLGLLTKDNWKNYPEEMLYWRAVSKGIRQVGGSLMSGAYTIEEISEGKASSVEELTAEVVETPVTSETKITEEQLKRKKEVEPTPEDEKENDKGEEEAEHKRFIKLIHIIKEEKEVSDEDYKNYIKSLSGGKFDSSKDLPLEQKERLLQFLKDLPEPQTSTEKEKEIQKEAEQEFPPFDDNFVKMQIVMKFEAETGEPKESLEIHKLFGFAEKWVVEDEPLTVQELIEKYPMAKNFFKSAVLPRLAKTKLYKKALEKELEK